MSNLYETQTLLDEYLLFHYGSEQELMPWSNGPKEALHFPVRTVSDLLQPFQLHSKVKVRALDLGCAVGRSSYELSSWAEEVVGIDYSHRFIEAAKDLLEKGSIPYQAREEAHTFQSLIAHRPEGYEYSRLQFQQGDAMNLPETLGSFDIVHAANLLCRLKEPKRLIERFPSLVNPQGQLLLTTPCTWLEEYTPKDLWPQPDTFRWLTSQLEDHFILDAQIDIPFVIREHARKFQWTMAMGTRWIRR